MPEFRREKADRLNDQKKRAPSIGVWALYERARTACKVSEDAVFNLSHSGKYVLCAIEDSGNVERKLGCDIQILVGNRLKVARCFCEKERQHIDEQPTEDLKVQELFRYWVLKESVMKATRIGMSLGTDTFEILFDGDNHPYMSRYPEVWSGPAYFREYVIADDSYKIAVCADTDEMAEEIEVITL